MDSPQGLQIVDDHVDPDHEALPPCNNQTSVVQVEQDCYRTSPYLPDHEENSGSQTSSDKDSIEPVRQSVISSPGGLKCDGCRQNFDPSLDTFTSVGHDMKYHQKCCICYECKTSLSDNNQCYVKEGHLYCKDDYLRTFGAQCAKCLKQISQSDLVQRVEDKIFHSDCFQCFCCHSELTGGQTVVYSRESNNFLCQSDYQKWQNTINAKYQAIPQRGGRQINYIQPTDYLQQTMYGPAPTIHHPNIMADRKVRKRRQERKPRERTVFSDSQLNQLIKYYEQNQRPSTQQKDKIAEELGISKKKVSVWFQNRRCKDKKKVERAERLDELARQQEEGRGFEDSIHPDYLCLPPTPEFVCKPIQGPDNHSLYIQSQADLPGEPQSTSIAATIPHLMMAPSIPSFAPYPYPHSLPLPSLPPASSPITPHTPVSPNTYHHRHIPGAMQNSPPLEASSPLSTVSDISPSEFSASQDGRGCSLPHLQYPSPPPHMGEPTGLQVDRLPHPGLYFSGTETIMYDFPPQHPIQPHPQAVFDSSPFHYPHPGTMPIFSPATPIFTSSQHV